MELWFNVGRNVGVNVGDFGGDAKSWHYQTRRKRQCWYLGSPRTKEIEITMKDKNNEQIVFEMLEEVATESIAEARNAYTYDEIDDCYVEAKKIAEVAKKELNNYMNTKHKT